MANQVGYPALLAAATDSEGISFASAACSAGYGKAMESLGDVVLNGRHVAAFVELHIEQGPFLEAAGQEEGEERRGRGRREEEGDVLFLIPCHYVSILIPLSGLPIGVVTAIAAPAALIVEFKGNGGHAGGTLMPYRWGLGFIRTLFVLSSLIPLVGFGWSCQERLWPGCR